MRISIPGHVFLNFSGTTQNWMAIVVPPHCPLPHGSSFLELDYWEETDHSEDLSNYGLFILGNQAQGRKNQLAEDSEAEQQWPSNFMQFH